MFPYLKTKMGSSEDLHLSHLNMNALSTILFSSFKEQPYSMKNFS